MIHFWVRPTNHAMLKNARLWLRQIRRPWKLRGPPKEKRIDQKCDEFTVILQIGIFVLLRITIDPRIDNANTGGRTIQPNGIDASPRPASMEIEPASEEIDKPLVFHLSRDKAKHHLFGVRICIKGFEMKRLFQRRRWKCFPGFLRSGGHLLPMCSRLVRLFVGERRFNNAPALPDVQIGQLMLPST